MEHFCFLVILPLLGLAMALQLTAPCQATQPQPQPIYDTEDHALTGDNFYNLMPVDLLLNGQCVNHSSIWKSGCPRNVNLALCDDSTSSRSVAVSIKLAAATNGSDKEASPRLSTDVVIEFGDTVNKCKQRLQWYVGAGITHNLHVTVGHFINTEGSDVLTDGRDQKFIFRVERYHGAYKLTSCYAPGCKHEPCGCRDLVLYKYNKKWWLVVKEKGWQGLPLVVVFEKCPRPCFPPKGLPHE
ncbi:hypothetical protein CFC21_044649 [Triticum aestivum]|uniref:Uncharacterized protein n=3 Tax=Triticum TaxID=4564 RepID=A0A9R1JXU2_WHEAT|nr:alpha-amylase/subtilisin inhibitor-like [Triticum aestivum]KAF7033564.1 hypothetical protein CFC21_044649 [Triticum aestivum]CDM86784.1 unnamed protein product [Triticum aestivum]VAH85802.1 unnamed protein product [Triticum turgidum subsp. durum]